MIQEEKTQSIILCEGFHDRSFWSGLLEFLNCPEPKSHSETGIISIEDPSGKPVRNGEFGYYSTSNKFIRIIPAKSKDKLWNVFETRLAKRSSEPVLTHLIVNMDSDEFIGNEGTKSDSYLNNLLVRTRAKIPSASFTPEGDIKSGDGLTVSLVRWETKTSDCEWLPKKQTLERLVCDAICEAYPERKETLTKWLAMLPPDSREEVKTFAWSLMAGWHADHSCDDFYKLIWRDPKIEAVLENRLKECGAWRIAQLTAS